MNLNMYLNYTFWWTRQKSVNYFFEVLFYDVVHKSWHFSQNNRFSYS